MNDDKIKALITQLDEEVPREGAKVILEQCGGGPDESQIVANQTGYLRLGIEFLKAAFAERTLISKKGYDSVPVNLDYLISEDSSVGFNNFEITESFPNSAYKMSTFDRIVPFIFLGFVVVVIILAFVGLGAIIKGIF